VAGAACIGVDIGGTKVRAGLVSADGALSALQITATPKDGDPKLLSELIVRLSRDLPPRETLASIGVALPGIRDEAGVMRRALHLPLLEGVDVRRLLQDALHRPVVLESDVNAAGVAQWGARPERVRRFVHLSLGTGVGGCAIVDGELLRHTRGGAGHFGMLVVDSAADAPCGRDGVRGSLGSVIERFAADGAASLERTARGVAVGMAQLAAMLAPDVIALGGGVIEHHDALLDAATVRFAELVEAHGMLCVERAALPGDHAGVIGVARLARDHDSRQP
jgi:glucokinase